MLAAAAACVGCTPAQRHVGASALAEVRRAEARTTLPSPVAPRAASPSMLPEHPPAALPPTRFLAGAEDLAVLALGLPMPVLDAPGHCTATPLHLPRAEADARAAAREAGRRDIATTFAFGMAFPVPAPPARFVDLCLDAAAEQAALSADEVVEVAPRVEGARRERTLRIAMLDLGRGPFRYDFRWTLRVSAEALPDGRHLVRYDFDDAAPRQRVSWFRGLAIVEPTAFGAFVREVIVAGSPVAPPFFLKQAVHDAAESILAKRWLRLAERAAGR